MAGLASSHRSKNLVQNKAIYRDTHIVNVAGLRSIRTWKNNEIYEKKNPIKSKILSVVRSRRVCESVSRDYYYQPPQVSHR